LFRAHIYTDDPIFMVIGVQRTLRALRLWRKITSRFRLLMAIPEKRKIGTMVKWLGFLPCPMHGLIVVQQSKLVRATLFVQQALSGALSVTRYRSLLGFLEHLKVLLSNAKTRMYGLYRPLQHGQEITQGPATLVKIDNRMHVSLNAWVLALATTAVAPVTYALPGTFQSPRRGMAVLLLRCFKGGYAYPSDCLWLPIAVLEFLALAVSIIVFAHLLDSAPHIVIETDSLTTALVLSSDSAKSPLLVEAHALLLATSEYTSLLSGLHSGAKWRSVISTARQISRPITCPVAIRLPSLCSVPT